MAERSGTGHRGTIRVLVADDHAVVREGVRALLATEPCMELVGEATDGIEAVAQTRALRLDVILLDLLMPRMDGVHAIGEITRDNPQARILVLTSFAGDDLLFPAIRAGALGYLLKDASPREVLDALRRVAEGESSLHSSIAHKVLRELRRLPGRAPEEKRLSVREVDVLRLVAQGLLNQEIARRLVISERTVRTHVSTVLRKLHLTNRTQATLYALREGLAHLESPVGGIVTPTDWRGGGSVP